MWLSLFPFSPASFICIEKSGLEGRGESDAYSGLEIAPEPPFLKPGLCPVDHARRSPGTTLRGAKGRPAGRIDGPIGGGATCAESEQSYDVQV